MTAIDDTIFDTATAIVGSTGSGKTYTAKGQVERMLMEGRRTCIIDPTGAWWGLRLAADGLAQSGLNVVIFGGDHADIPITPGSGDKMAVLIARDEVPQSLIDISNFSGGQATHFLTDFLEGLYDLNRDALHLILDEADFMAPQKPFPEQRRMQGAVDKIARRGRIRGFRPMLITQRPQVIDKSVLSQCSTLIAMWLRAPQDRKAIMAWVEGNASTDEAKAIVAQLASLARGTGFVWSPVADILEKVEFPLIQTFDSSRAPAPGERRAEPVPLTKIDLDAITKALAPPPVTDKTTVPANQPPPLEVGVIRKKAYEEGFNLGYGHAKREMQDQLRRAGQTLLDMAINTPSAPVVTVTGIDPDKQEPATVEALKTVAAAVCKESFHTESFVVTDEPDIMKPTPLALSPTARKILDEIHAAYPVTLTLKAAALRAGASPKSSMYGTYCRQVIRTGEIQPVGSDRWVSLKPSDRPSGSVIDQFSAKLKPSVAGMLRAIAKHATGLSRHEIALQAGVSPTSSGLTAGLKELVDLDLIRRDSRSWYFLTDHAK